MIAAAVRQVAQQTACAKARPIQATPRTVTAIPTVARAPLAPARARTASGKSATVVEQHVEVLAEVRGDDQRDRRPTKPARRTRLGSAEHA